MLGFVFFGLTGILAYIAAAGTMIGLSYLGGVIFAPKQPKVKSDKEVEGAESRMFGPHTSQREGLTRPRSYGENLHHGNITAKWTDVRYNREVLYLAAVSYTHLTLPTKA